MFYKKNIPAWERAVRVTLGLLIVVAGVLGLLPKSPLILLSGGLVALTGFSGFCPMCALAGRTK